MLVLRYVETLPRPRDWRMLLDVPASSTSETLELEDSPLGRLDHLVLVLVVSTLVFVALRSGA
jgi:hypothetical protein